MAVKFFAQTFFQGTSQADIADTVGIMSPFSAAFSLPLNIADDENPSANISAPYDLRIFFWYLGWSAVYNTALVLTMMRLFQVRWRVAD